MSYRVVPYNKFDFEAMKSLAPNLPGLIQLIKGGSKPTPPSYLVEKASPQALLKETLGIIENSCAGMKILADTEIEKVSKFGPQGANPPWVEKKDKFYEYYKYAGKSYADVYSSKEWKKAKENVLKSLKMDGSKRPYSSERVVEVMRKSGKLGTNSGAPLFIKKREPRAIEQAIETAALGSKGYKPLWAQLGNRSQRGKSRFIFMFPFATTIYENAFVMPLLQHLKALNKVYFSAWEGFKRVERDITPMIENHAHLVGTDFTGMDQHFTVDKSLEVYAVVKHFFQKKYWTSLKESMCWAHEIHVLTPDGMVYGEHGMASGSGWTNLSETVFNLILSEYISVLRSDSGSNPDKYAGVAAMGLGDDGFMATNYENLADTFVEAANSVGLESNRSKQVESPDYTHYLQRTFIRGYKSPFDPNVLGGVYPLVLGLNSLIYPERFINPKEWSGKMFVIRCLMILENSVNHPGFEPFCKMIFKLNSNFPKFAQLSQAETSKEEAKARAINGFIPSYNQEKADTSLTSFQSYKILKRLYS